MSPLRRILVAGLPAAALSVATSLALAGSPAAAAEHHAGRPMLATTPCAEADRDKCDYGPAGTGPTATGGGVSGGPTRGHGGYGSTAPTPSTPATTQPTPSQPTPTASVDTVPPTSPSVTIQGSETPTPTPSISGGVSAGHALPVTGPPMGTIVTLGALMVAAGATSVWYTRRRRNT
jgi:hypothetical protein